MTKNTEQYHYLYLSVQGESSLVQAAHAGVLHKEHHWIVIALKGTGKGVGYCVILSKNKDSITEEDQQYIEKYSHVPDNWSYPDVKEGFVHEYPAVITPVVKPKLLVIGHAGHGKDTVCQILKQNHGYSSISSSQAAFDRIIWPSLRWYYLNREQAWSDKENRRTLWFELVRLLNSEDETTLARKVWAEYDVYNGMRSLQEYHACRQAELFDYCIWVDAAERLPPESSSSMELTKAHSHIDIDNNGSHEALTEEVAKVIAVLTAAKT